MNINQYGVYISNITMEQITNNPLEEIEIRIQNLQSVIDVISYELNLLLLEKKRLSEIIPIGFIIKWNNEKKTTRKYTSHN